MLLPIATRKVPADRVSAKLVRSVSNTSPGPASHMLNRRPDPADKPGCVNASRIRVAAGRIAATSCLALLLAPGAGPAADSGDVAAVAMTGDGWRAENVEFRFADLTRTGLTAELRVARFVLSEPRLELRDIRIECPGFTLSWREAHCPDARVRVKNSPLDLGDFRATFTHRFDTSETRVDARRVKAAGGTLNIGTRLRPSGWQANVLAEGLTPAALGKLAVAFTDLPEIPQLLGQINAQVTAAGSATSGTTKARISFLDISGGNDAGTAASEKLNASLSLEASRSDSGWRAELGVESSSGQLYVHPLFVDFAEYPLSGTVELTETTPLNWLVKYQVQQAGIGRADGVAEVGDGAWRKPGLLELNIPEASLPGAYLVYLQPLLVGTAADSLESVGSVRGRLRLRSGALQSLQLELDDLHIDDTRNRFALYGIDGSVNWEAQGTTQSRVSWQGGYGYRIGFGAAALAFAASGNHLQLASPAKIPVLDGALLINEFAIHNFGQPDVSLNFDGDIEPIGMRALTRALGWPPFSGSVSGSIPRMRYTGDAVTVDGILSARVFDGTVTVEKLRLSDPLGVLPELQAGIRLRRLDLASLTSAFSFGVIEGRLDGEISDMRMLGFSPVRFDAQLYTTPGDKSRRRISQQAIENISDLGGAGAGAVLSRGMLRFFESFAYDVIGWSCVLEDEVCRMDGVAPAPGTGYYIVRGKGLPRINVIGFSRRVSWPLLVEKLREISAGNTPEIR